VARADDPPGAAAKARNPDAVNPDAVAPTLPRPAWKVGDSWVIETVTDRVQDRTARVPRGAAIRWEFKVAAIEKLNGQDCYRIDVTCQATGRVRPETSLWCGTRTLTLRQMRTTIAVAGQYRTILESYDAPANAATPVLTPLNALPIDLPAFLPPGAKGLGSFRYVSQPLPAGSKDPTLVRFAHTVKQDIAPAGAKALEQVPTQFAKDLERKPIVEVRLQDHERTVTQLWQPGKPWPVFTNNGRTRATLVSVGEAP